MSPICKHPKNINQLCLPHLKEAICWRRHRAQHFRGDWKPTCQYICLWCVGWTLNFVDTFIDRLRIQLACTGATPAAASWFWWGCILVSKYIKPLRHEACNTQRLNHGTRSLWLLQVEANLPEAVRRKEEVRIWCVQMPVDFCNFLPPTYSDLQVLFFYSCLISPVSSVFSNQIRL